MRLQYRYWVLALFLLVGSAASGITFEQNPFRTAADTFRGRVLGFELFRIPSNSMQPTLMPGDFIWVSTRAYKDQPPQINDVITFLYPKDKSINYIKRLIGRPGDTVRIDDFQVYVNDQKIPQPYLKKELVQKPYSRYMQQLVIPQGKLFVMGDNRDNSNDGRFFGLVSQSDLIGKATIILFGKGNRTGNSIQ